MHADEDAFFKNASAAIGLHLVHTIMLELIS